MNEQILLKRINRKLAYQDERVRKARVFDPSLGDYFIVDTSLNAIVGTHIDLEELGVELGVVR